MIPAFLLVLLAVAYRLMTGLMIHSGATWLSNFAPLAALALCSAAYFPTRFKFTVPLIALFVSDLVLNYHYGAAFFDSLIICRYLTLGLIGLIGLALEKRASLRTMLPASIVGSTIFYFITCVFAWLTDPGYVRNFAGLIQSLTVGLTAYSATPSWMFFRNSLMSDLVFTALFVVAVNFSRSAEGSRNQTALARPA
ncbi:MAG: DUF6580 family putative transport protein [Spartobacteria bacterium]